MITRKEYNQIFYAGEDLQNTIKRILTRFVLNGNHKSSEVMNNMITEIHNIMNRYLGLLLAENDDFFNDMDITIAFDPKSPLSGDLAFTLRFYKYVDGEPRWYIETFEYDEPLTRKKFNSALKNAKKVFRKKIKQ